MPRTDPDARRAWRREYERRPEVRAKRRSWRAKPGPGGATNEARLASPHLRHRKDYCEECGMTPRFWAVLAVHHLDHNHRNNDPANLKTLCQNCHAELHAAERGDAQVLQ